MAWFNLQGIIDLLQLVYNYIIQLVNTVNDIALGIPGYVLSLVWALVQAIPYPLFALDDVLVDYLHRVSGNFTGIADNMWALYVTIVDVFWEGMGLVVDGSLFTLMMASVALVVTFRIYFFVKDISVAGFKV